jgi:hypothetical protein
MEITGRTATATVTGLLAAAALAAGAHAAGWGHHSYVVKTLTDPIAHSLPVTGPLSDFRVGSEARVVVPTSWRALKAPAGTLRFAVRSNGSCGYTVTLSVDTRLAPRQAATDYLDGVLPIPTPLRLIDSGTRGSSAFRLVRPTGLNERIRLTGLWATILTRRDDIAPQGTVAWTELHATAISGPHDECHLGTWKAALGPQIGDVLATARTDLNFIERTKG